ncbi:MAG: alpha/beta hydrolase [Nitrospiraceae bacterium]|nr:alpha/beta hydrolase [Nitrospiraceae bacterium]
MTFKINASELHEVSCRVQEVEGVRIFYREAGSSEFPVMLMLHGFPSSSFYFRNLIPVVAEKFHVIAPDYPGFGHSSTPEVDKFSYSFDHLADVMQQFLDVRKINKYVIFMQDYGGPVGMRLAARYPERISGLVFQNANIYEEGLTERFLLKKPLWVKRTGATEAPVLRNMEPDSIRGLYMKGTRKPQELNPDGWTMDVALMERPGNKAIQLELQADYGSNLQKYPEWQAYLRKYRPPTLVVWGKGDPVFGPNGAEAFRRDVPDAEIHLLDTGHFALEEDANAVAGLLDAFAKRMQAQAVEK